MKLSFNKNLPGIQQIEYNGVDLIFPWGLEFAGRDFFFSLNGNSRGVHKTEVDVQKLDECIWCTQIRVFVKGAIISIKLNESVKGCKVLRKAVLRSNHDVEITGLAIRFQFSSQYFSSAIISDVGIVHEKSGVYHMYPVEEAMLCGDLVKAQLSYTSPSLPEGLRCYTYVRDVCDSWIVHLRILPDPDNVNTIRFARFPEKLVLRLLFQRSLNALLRLNILWKYFWHIPERNGRWKIPLSAYGLFFLKKDADILIETEVVFRDA